MKKLKIGILLVLCTMSLLQASAQDTAPPLNQPNYNLPKIFSDLPDAMAVNVLQLESLLKMPVGASVNIALTKKFFIAGTIVSKSAPADPQVSSVVVKCTVRQGATFTFSRIAAPDGTVSYLGRVWNKSCGDALEVVKKGQDYVIRKTGLYDLLNE